MIIDSIMLGQIIRRVAPRVATSSRSASHGHAAPSSGSSNPILQMREKYFTRNNLGKLKLLSYFSGIIMLQLYLGAEFPTYTKVPGDLVFVTVAFAGLATGLTCIGRFMYKLCAGAK